MFIVLPSSSSWESCQNDAEGQASHVWPHLIISPNITLAVDTLGPARRERRS